MRKTMEMIFIVCLEFAVVLSTISLKPTTCYPAFAFVLISIRALNNHKTYVNCTDFGLNRTGDRNNTASTKIESSSVFGALRRKKTNSWNSQRKKKKESIMKRETTTENKKCNIINCIIYMRSQQPPTASTIYILIKGIRENRRKEKSIVSGESNLVYLVDVWSHSIHLRTMHVCVRVCVLLCLWTMIYGLCISLPLLLLH